MSTTGSTDTPMVGKIGDEVRPRSEGLASQAVPAVEREVAVDMVKKGVKAAPILIGLGWAVWGWQGAASSAYGVALIVANFLLAALLLTQAAKISFAALGAAAMFGYLIRLGLIMVAVLAVRNQPWVKMVPLGLTIIVTHLGLLVWELKYVSASFAHPGLKPKPFLTKE